MHYLNIFTMHVFEVLFSPFSSKGLFHLAYYFLVLLDESQEWSLSLLYFSF